MNLNDLLGETSALAWFIDQQPADKKIIGYRRCAGKIGLTSRESGTRGAWVEKRVVLLKNLIESGCYVQLLSPTTEATTNEGVERSNTVKHLDALILEFSGTNMQFFGNDWADTFRYLQLYPGIPVFFVCDDPDLSFLWKYIKDDWSRWTILANATNVDGVREILNVPSEAKVIDLPMAAGMKLNEFSEITDRKVVYIGRPDGRAKQITPFLDSSFIDVAAKAKEWKGWNFNYVDVPQQRERVAFYQRYRGCLAFYDKKHTKSGWRTGRAYHALYAGIPVLSPPGNPGLSWTHPVEDPSQIESFVNSSLEARKNLWEIQVDSAERDKQKAKQVIHDCFV